MKTTSFTRAATLSRLMFWSYLALIALAEGLLAFGDVRFGVTLHVALLIGLTFAGGVQTDSPTRRATLALVPVVLARVLSLAPPLAQVPPVVWPLLVAAPLLFATAMLIRQLGVSRAALGLRTGGNLRLQLTIAGGGLGLGMLTSVVRTPAPLIETFTPLTVLLVALMLIIATGFAEELIFRGLLQSVIQPTMGKWTLIYGALLFTAMHIDYRSAPLILLAFGIGLLFAVIVQLSGSILGITLAHGLLNVTLFLINPYLQQQQPDGLARLAILLIIWGWTAASVFALGLIAFDTWQSKRAAAVQAAAAEANQPDSVALERIAA
jgi:hypothetical protein